MARPPRAVREPVQVYLGADDKQLLDRLVQESGLSMAEILRQGVRAFAREHGVGSPMLAFVADSARGTWSSEVALDHDAVIAATHAAPRRRKR